jgi:hypothetical protein
MTNQPFSLSRDLSTLPSGHYSIQAEIRRSDKYKIIIRKLRREKKLKRFRLLRIRYRIIFRVESIDSNYE